MIHVGGYDEYDHHSYFFRIIAHVTPVISNTMLGFMQNKSSFTNLGRITDFIETTLDKGGQIDVIYIDLARAFDKVDHCIFYNLTT